MEIDKVDAQILGVLSSDGRKSLRKIAKEVGVSSVTVISRVNTLKEKWIIKKFTVAIDPTKVGYELTAIANLKISKGKMLSIQEKIAKQPNVCGVYDITGEYDSMIIARFKNMADMNKFIKTVLSAEGIERSYTTVALNVVKEDFGVNF